MSVRKLLLTLGIVGGVAVAAGFGLRGTATRAAGFLSTRVERGDVRRAVSATGTLKAVITVQVGSQVTGVIQSLGADFNSVVTEGQVIARIDPSTFQAQLERAEADLAAARAQHRGSGAALQNQRANRAVIQANLDGAVASRDQANRILERSRGLAAQGVLSINDLEAAEARALEARSRVAALDAQLEQSDAQLHSAEAQVEQARSQIDQATAAVTIAGVNLDHTIIASPIDGVVISRSVDVGQTVAASLSAPTLFVLANDLRKMNVIASIDEADIGSISQETPVTFTVDAFSGETFAGHIHQVRLEPQTVQNVVTYNVIVDVDNPNLKLRPGMTANVTLSVAEATNVLKLPNAALRFWPEDVPRSRMDEILGDTRAGKTEPGLASGTPNAAGTSVPSAAEVASAVELSPEATALVAAMRDPSLSQDARRELFGRMRKLPDAERARIREMMGFGEGGGGRRRERALGGAGSTDSGELRFPAPPTPTPSARVVWVQGEKANNELEPRRVMVSITDGSVTAVVGGDLADGDTVVIGQSVADGSTGQARSPFTPAIGGGRGGGGGRR